MPAMRSSWQPDSVVDVQVAVLVEVPPTRDSLDPTVVRISCDATMSDVCYIREVTVVIIEDSGRCVYTNASHQAISLRTCACANSL